MTPTLVRPGTAPRLRIARRLAPAQALYVFGTSVDMTLTGIVGARLAPTTALATLPYSLMPVAAFASTFVFSRLISRVGYRAVFTAAAAVAAAAGLVSALAVQLDAFWLFCVGTGMIGVYSAGAGYYRYAAADASGAQRARAVTTVLAGGLVAALVGPFLATWASGITPVAFVGSYLLVALLGALAVTWNALLPPELATRGRAAAAGVGGAQAGAETEPRASAGLPRGRRVLWRQPTLIAGVATTSFAAITMTAMMTAGPIAGMAMGHSEADAAFAVQLHMIGMFAPGFVIARVIGRLGERMVTLAGTLLVVVAGAAAAVSTAEWAFLTAMFAVGVGWNLAYSGGSAMIASSYRAAERGQVQPIAEAITSGFQMTGSLSAGLLANVPGWRSLGLGMIVLALAAALGIAATSRAARRKASPVGTWPGPV